MSECPDLSAHTEGRDVQLVLRNEIGGVLSEAKKEDNDARCLAKAAHVVRRDILKVKNSFNGSFSSECQKNSVPPSLLTLLSMLIKGSTTQTDPSDSQAVLSVAQLIVFNSVSRSRNRQEATGSTHHVRQRECPLPIYNALKIHGTTRDKLGLCIS